MHKKVNAVLAFGIMMVMLVAAVVWGACKGWAGERLQIEQSMDTLYEILNARREIGNNILTVAQRHLQKEDALLRTLRDDMNQMEKNSDFDTLARVNADFERDASALLQHVSMQPSLKADERDSMYILQMLPQALNESARMTEQVEYNEQAEGFNQRMRGSFSGRIAHALGIDYAQQFVVQEEAQ